MHDTVQLRLAYRSTGVDPRNPRNCRGTSFSTNQPPHNPREPPRHVVVVAGPVGRTVSTFTECAFDIR